MDPVLWLRPVLQVRDAEPGNKDSFLPVVHDCMTLQ